MSPVSLTSGDATNLATQANAAMAAFGGTITHNVTFWVIVATAGLITFVVACLLWYVSHLGQRVPPSSSGYLPWNDPLSSLSVWRRANAPAADDDDAPLTSFDSQGEYARSRGDKASNYGK